MSETHERVNVNNSQWTQVRGAGEGGKHSPRFTTHSTLDPSLDLDLGNSLSDPAVTQLPGAGEVNSDQKEAAVAEAPPKANPEDVNPGEASSPAQATEPKSPEVTASQNDIPVAPATVEQQTISAVAEQNNTVPAQNGDAWQQREAELLKLIENLESVQGAAGADKMSLTLKARENEIELLRARVLNLETELQAALSKPGGKNQEMIDNIKLQHEDLLSKARGMIFDKTKMVKNQELQIEALTTQVQSLKDINAITKDLLDIRNQEVKAMEDRFQVMELKQKAEKEKHGLVLQRAETSTGLNEDLKKEYETQLGLFKNLRVKYDERVQALIAENERLKEELKASSTS